MPRSSRGKRRTFLSRSPEPPSGGGSPEATRRAFNKRFLLDLAEDWQQHGREVFKRVRRESPAAYLKVCAMLVPKEMKVEHSGGVKAMTDEQIEQAIEAIQTMLEQQAKVIEGTAETVALPAPQAKRKVPSTPGAARSRSSRSAQEDGCSSLPCRGVLSFRLGAREASGSETPRVHNVAWWCGGVAARGARAAARPVVAWLGEP